MTTEEKIKKLLDLSGSPNVHEAKLALDKARELMAKYCITISNASDEPQKVILDYYVPPIRVTGYNFKYCVSIVNVLSAHFGVIVVVENRNRIQCYGFEHSIKLAKYGFDSIFNQLNSVFKLGYVEERSLSYSEAFWCGAAHGIEDKFSLKKEDKNEAMIVYDPVHAKLQSLKLTVYDAIYNPASEIGQIQGKKAGNEASLYQGLNQTTEKGNLLQ